MEQIIQNDMEAGPIRLGVGFPQNGALFMECPNKENHSLIGARLPPSPFVYVYNST